MLNKLLGGHYLVVQTLGSGGFAKTYIAEDLHRPGHPKCAVKYLRPASSNPDFLPIARRLFNKEAETLEKLGQHDQIPRLLAYFEEKQKFYLVQEFIQGHTLNTELPPGHRWSENKVIRMLQDVLPILQFVHSYGVIHRDIKPNNLIRRQKDGRLVLIDFGAVKQVRDPNITSHEPLTQKTISIGTQGYIPIEQELGEPRLNSDIYALGAITIQALTGIHPLQLEEEAQDEIIWQNLAEVSDELAAILSKMVRSNFKQRYQSVTEILQALESLTHYYTPIQSTSDTKQTTLKVALRLDLPKTKEFLDVKHRDVETVPNSNLQRTKAVLDNERQTTELAYEKKKKSNLFSPAKSQDLEFNRANAFVPLNKYRLSIGVGIVSLLVTIIAGYTYITKRQSYFQTQRALTHIETLKTAEKYPECIQKAETFPRDYSDLHAEAENLLDECQQSQAEQQRQLAEARRLEEQKLAEARRQTEQQRLAELKSDRGIDYSQLRNYLKAGNWKEADLETYNVMLEATNGDNLGKESIGNFPCIDLKTINSLWQKYSDDRFGFSIQNKEYQNLSKSFNSLGNKLGWRQGSWITYDYLSKRFDPNVVPVGHLPARVFKDNYDRWAFQRRIVSILDRTNDCNL